MTSIMSVKIRALPCSAPLKRKKDTDAHMYTHNEDADLGVDKLGLGWIGWSGNVRLVAHSITETRPLCRWINDQPIFTGSSCTAARSAIAFPRMMAT